MKSITMKDLMPLWVAIVFCIMGFGIGSITTQPPETDFKRLVDGNSTLIHSLGVTAQMQSTNAGLIQEIMDELKSADEKFGVKPTKTRDKSLFELYGNFELDSDVPTTYKQVILDQKEINLSIQSLGWGNAFMEESLRQILNKIKNKN